ncbi:MAG: inorganic phosphate transporter [Clostridia bacterium]|nr:inorganic phosphate transporter [Clostridia bacterium]
MTIIIIIFCAALFIDGATDCANSVTGAVSSKALSLRHATVLSAALSFLGCTVFCLFFPAVAESFGAVSFSDDTRLIAVAVSLFCTALWSAFAWLLGLPTSEGHALISAMAGAALALGGKIHVLQLLVVLAAVLPSAALSALLSVPFVRLFAKTPKRNRKPLIILSCALSSFFHGAQDGQKFLALALSARLISNKAYAPTVLVFAAVMGIGTLFGRRIIKKMGLEMISADEGSALAADLSGALSLAALTALGVPASTTHVRITALTAATRAAGGRCDGGIFALLCSTWVATFPVCFALSYFASRLFLVIFL